MNYTLITAVICQLVLIFCIFKYLKLQKNLNTSEAELLRGFAQSLSNLNDRIMTLERKDQK